MELKGGGRGGGMSEYSHSCLYRLLLTGLLEGVISIKLRVSTSCHLWACSNILVDLLGRFFNIYTHIFSHHHQHSLSVFNTHVRRRRRRRRCYWDIFAQYWCKEISETLDVHLNWDLCLLFLPLLFSLIEWCVGAAEDGSNGSLH